MVALWSFGQEAARILGIEQFLGFYVSAGKTPNIHGPTRLSRVPVDSFCDFAGPPRSPHSRESCLLADSEDRSYAGLMSAMASHLGRARSTVGGFSMGASGAVYACFALTAMHKPDTEVTSVFLFLQ